MMMDLPRDGIDDEAEDDSDRTESYTPPPLDVTTDHSGSEKENQTKDRQLFYADPDPIKEESIIVLDDSFEQTPIRKSHRPSTHLNDPPMDNYWEQWPLMNHTLPDDERDNLYSIPDIDIPPSPPPAILSSPEKKTSPVINEATTILNILTRPSSLPRPLRTSDPSRKKPPVKRKKKKKPMSEYRPPSPFSPKPDYKSLDAQQLKTYAIRYGISNSLAKGRLVKVLDEIYSQTHQYETDTDFEYEPDAVPKQRFEKKDLARTPPTPAAMPDVKKVKKRPVVHQMSSSDEMEQEPRPALSPPEQKSPANTTTDDDDAEHEGRFLELTVYNLSSSTSSSRSLSTIGTPPKLTADAKESPTGAASQASSTGKSKSQPVTTESDSKTKKKAVKRPKLETPTLPLKDIVRSYIEANPILHARILSYEPIDFEEFHNQMKSELNLKIVSKELMQCLDDQCITFTLRARKGAFTSVMRAKRRHK